MGTLELDDGTLHYEVIGQGSGPRAVCMGGWGTYCHGGEGDIPRAITSRFETLVFDYRGLGSSVDRRESAQSMQGYAADVIALFDHLGWDSANVVGLVGMGACIGQELAIGWPERVRSLVMTGTWARCDATLRDILELFVEVHRSSGWEQFQKMAAAFSFEPKFYGSHRSRVLGETGAWSDLHGRWEAHARLVEACIEHDALGRLELVRAPSLVLHAGQDVITGPRYTLELEKNIPGCKGEWIEEAAHVLAGRERRAAFDALLHSFFDTVVAGERSEINSPR